jgi:hypothetical protein
LSHISVSFHSKDVSIISVRVTPDFIGCSWSAAYLFLLPLCFHPTLTAPFFLRALSLHSPAVWVDPTCTISFLATFGGLITLSHQSVVGG